LLKCLHYTPGWLAPDGPKLSLAPHIRIFLEKKEEGEESVYSTVCSKVGRAVAAYRAIVQILDCFIPEIRTRNYAKLTKSRHQLWIDILDLSIKNKMESFLKMDFQQLMAYGTKKNNTRNAVYVFTGFIKDLLLTRAVRMSNKGESGRQAAALIRSLYESKRCWLAMADELKDDAMKKHQSLLGTEKGCSPIARSWIRTATDMIIPPGTKYYSKGYCVPTSSASFETNKKDGGNHTAVLGEVLRKKVFTEKEKRVRHSDEATCCCVGCRPDRLYTSTPVLPGKEFGMCQMGDIQKFSDDLEGLLIEAGDEETNDVEFMALAEPGKYRIITKGREKIYSGFRVFQRFLIDAWKACPFGTMHDNVFESILGLRDLEGSVYLSGDYDSATDAMSLEATLECVRRILSNLGLTDTPLGKAVYRSFSETFIHYPDGTVLKQVRGQLMGHPLSFVILCIINLSTYLRTHLITNKDDPKLKNVRINGDDILFKGESEDGPRWRTAADDVGLIVNEAKTYESSRYALINSIFVDMTSSRKISYVPLSVSLGHNVKRGEGTKTLSQAPQIWALCQGAPNERSRKMCSRTYMRTLPKLIPKFGTFTPNYFLHKDVGGLGLTPPEGWKFGVTYLQRKVGTYFVRHRSEIALREKIYEMPRSVKRALEKLGRIAPKGDNWYIGGKPVQGPLQQHEDLGEYLQDMMPIVLRSTQWIVGAGSSLDTEERALAGLPSREVTHNWRKALKWEEAPMKVKKLKCYEPSRQVVWVQRPAIVSDPEEFDQERVNREHSLSRKELKKRSNEEFRIKREAYTTLYREAFAVFYHDYHF